MRQLCGYLLLLTSVSAGSGAYAIDLGDVPIGSIIRMVNPLLPGHFIFARLKGTREYSDIRNGSKETRTGFRLETFKTEADAVEDKNPTSETAIYDDASVDIIRRANGQTVNQKWAAARRAASEASDLGKMESGAGDENAWASEYGGDDALGAAEK